MNISTTVVKIRKIKSEADFSETPTQLEEDRVAVEEPLEIRLDYLGPKGRMQQSVSITMRTPGHDFDLALGFLFTEGLIRTQAEIRGIDYCGPQKKKTGNQNVVKVELQDSVQINLKSLERHFYTTSSCGVCGKSSIDALKVQNPNTQAMKEGSGPFAQSSWKSSWIHQAPSLLRESQAVFESTGGLHASGVFDSAGKLLMVREDVGRHNALDKLIGRALQDHGLPLSNHFLMLSGRVSFELVQKAAMAGIQVVGAVGAPSSLALELAQEMKMTLIGFIRNQKFNLYCGEWRVK
jgi:FdhD protein